jgi:hypothetical protein
MLNMAAKIFVLVRVRGDEALAVGLMNGDGFFDQDVQAGGERLDADGGVAEMRRADQDGVDVADWIILLTSVKDARPRAAAGRCRRSRTRR